MWQSRPFLLAAGNAMCNDLRNGATPDDIAGRFFYPNATRQNLIEMATAAQSSQGKSTRLARFSRMVSQHHRSRSTIRTGRNPRRNEIPTRTMLFD